MDWYTDTVYVHYSTCIYEQDDSYVFSLIAANGCGMGLCEEFRELYDKYIEKVEKDLETHKSKIKITGEKKKLAMDKIWERIESED